MSAIIPAATNRSLFGTIGGVIGAIGGFAVGGVGGAVAGAQAGSAIGNAVSGSTPPAGNTGGAAAGGSGFVGYGIGQGVGNSKPACGFGDIAGCLAGTCQCFGTNSLAPTSTAAGGCMKGYHLNKSTLNPTRGGCGRAAHGVIPKHTVLVRNRHMHYGNTRAARRAIHRLKGAHRIFKQIDKLIGPKRRAGRASFRRRR